MIVGGVVIGLGLLVGEIVLGGRARRVPVPSGARSDEARMIDPVSGQVSGSDDPWGGGRAMVSDTASAPMEVSSAGVTPPPTAPDDGSLPAVLADPDAPGCLRQFATEANASKGSDHVTEKRRRYVQLQHILSSCDEEGRALGAFAAAETLLTRADTRLERKERRIGVRFVSSDDDTEALQYDDLETGEPLTVDQVAARDR